jgi:Rv0078B-related antitoxin
VDAIRQDDIDWARKTPPGEKVAEALKMMRFGIRLKRSALAASHPDASEAEIDAMLQAWLEADG